MCVYVCVCVFVWAWERKQKEQNSENDKTLRRKLRWQLRHAGQGRTRETVCGSEQFKVCGHPSSANIYIKVCECVCV